VPDRVVRHRGRLAPAGQRAKLRRQDFTADQLGVHRQCLSQVSIRGLPANRDAVRHVQPVGLAGVLDQPDDVPGQPLTAELGGDRHLECHRLAAVGGDRPAGQRSLRHDHVVRLDRDPLAVDGQLRGA